MTGPRGLDTRRVPSSEDENDPEQAHGREVTHRAFICHSKHDRVDFVDEFATKLGEKGIDTWLAGWELLPGDSLVSRVYDVGMTAAGVLLIVLSKHSVASRWIRDELDTAMVRRIDRRMRLVPIRIDDCDVPEPLRSIYWIDVARIGLDRAVGETVVAVYERIQRPAIGERSSNASKGLSIPGLADADATFLRVLYEQAVALDDTTVELSRLVAALADEGIVESAVEETVSVLEELGYVDGHKAVLAGLHQVRLRNEGIETLLSAAMPAYDDLVNRCALLLLNEYEKDAESLVVRLALPLVFVNHVLEVFEQRAYIELSDKAGRFHRVAAIKPTLRRFTEDADD